MALAPSEYETTRLQKPSSAGAWLPKLIFIVVLAGAGYWGYQYWSHAESPTSDSKKEGKKQAVVTVAPVSKQDVAVTLSAIGTVIPRNIVTVRTQIDGQLIKVAFQEGQYVKKGQLLAEIDPRPYQVQLAQAQGQMEKDTALLRNAQLDLDRYKKLLAQDSAPEQQVATQNALVNQYLGTLQTDKSQIDSAKLQLTYARIVAPISGRIGLRQVDAGNVVHQTDTNGLLSIAEVKPITVIFSIPQDQLPDVLSAMRNNTKLPVQVIGKENKTVVSSGTLLSVDNQIDTTTGTVKLKAIFENEDEQLFPNQFVNVSLQLGTKKDALVVPTAGVQQGTKGAFVYVATPENTIHVVPVHTSVTQGDVVVVEGGLSEGEHVVVTGADKLREGAKARIASDKAKGDRGDDSASGKHHGKHGASKTEAGEVTPPEGEQKSAAVEQSEAQASVSQTNHASSEDASKKHHHQADAQ